jgi:hypothetical protein
MLKHIAGANNAAVNQASPCLLPNAELACMQGDCVQPQKYLEQGRP